MDRAMPAGTDAFQLELAPSGHMVLPCCEYQSASTANEHTLTLVSRAGTGPPAGEGNHGSSSSSIPPVPVAPP
eukprot:11227815-Lingulodinium_polyedra.AAC.1